EGAAHQGCRAGGISSGENAGVQSGGRSGVVAQRLRVASKDIWTRTNPNAQCLNATLPQDRFVVAASAAFHYRDSRKTAQFSHKKRAVSQRAVIEYSRGAM